MKIIKSKYRPHPKQVLFHQTYAPYKLFLAGIGTGKTLAGVHEILNLASMNPGHDGLVSAPTFPMLRDVILPLWEEYIPGRLYKFYKKDQLFELWSGQKLYLRSFERPDAIRGLNLGYAWADELAMVQSQEAWNILLGRVGRTTSVPHPCIFATTTPRGWNWLARKFLKNASSDFVTIRARSADSPYFNPALLERLRHEYGEEFARQELDAEVIEEAGKVLTIIPEVHCNWNFKDISGGRYKRRVVAAVDWGYSAPACILVAMQVQKTGKWYVCEEFYKRKMMSEDLYGVMTQLKAKWKIKYFYADSAEPERIASANRRGLSCIPVKKGAGSIKSGITEARSLLSVDRTGTPGCYVHQSCKHLINECDNFHYDSSDSEKMIAEEGDHAIDCFRYIAMGESKGPLIVGIG